MPNFWTIKIFWTESIKWYNRKIEPFSFEYPKKSHLKSSYPKRLLPKCFYLKASWNWKFQTHKSPSIVAVIWNPEYPPPGSACKIKIIKNPQHSQWSTITLRYRWSLPKMIPVTAFNSVIYTCNVGMKVRSEKCVEKWTVEKLTVGKDPSEIHEKASLYNYTLFKTFTTWSAIREDGRRVLLTACDISSVQCLMQILTAFFFFIFWCLRVSIYVTSEMPSND